MEFGGEAQGWLNLQSAYDLRLAEISAGKAIANAITPLASATGFKKNTRAQISKSGKAAAR